MVRWNKGGGMTTTILTDMFKTLDELKLFDRSGGNFPFSSLMVMGPEWKTNFLNTLITLTINGVFALASLMAQAYGKLEIPRSKMAHSIWRP